MFRSRNGSWRCHRGWAQKRPPLESTSNRWKVNLGKSLNDQESKMRVLLLLIFTLALAGCTTKSKAKAQANAAFNTGQRQALERVLQQRNSVTVMGPVRNPLVPW